MWPQVESPTSKLASANGSASASPSRKSMSPKPSCSAFRRATASSSGVRSTPVTRAPRSRAAMAVMPVPVARSSTRSPGRSLATRSVWSVETDRLSAMRSYSPSAQVARCFCLSSLGSVRWLAL
jgi:hypothetical protein